MIQIASFPTFCGHSRLKQPSKQIGRSASIHVPFRFLVRLAADWPARNAVMPQYAASGVDQWRSLVRIRALKPPRKLKAEISKLSRWRRAKFVFSENSAILRWVIETGPSTGVSAQLAPIAHLRFTRVATKCGSAMIKKRLPGSIWTIFAAVAQNSPKFGNRRPSVPEISAFSEA